MDGYLPLTDASTSPLAAALAARDAETLSMVADAIRCKRVQLAFQPVVLAGDMTRLAFFEGLIRILDRTGRVIPAREFIGAVEAHEIGRQIDCLALEFGLAALRENPTLRLSVNMSARSIGYPSWIRTLEAGLAPDPFAGERLILEITENSAIAVPETVQAFMADLQEKGICFALDDFGAGYSSFRHLRDLYFDILKIDGRFIRGVHRTPDDQALVSALLSVGQHFDMLTVAESVESLEDADWLAEIGIDCLQGYYFGAPTLRPDWSATDNLGAAALAAGV